jgi:hypothetical protein
MIKLDFKEAHNRTISDIIFNLNVEWYYYYENMMLYVLLYFSKYT